MDRVNADTGNRKKRVRPNDREYNTAVYLLRCAELGLHDNDLEFLTYGMVLDMMTEKSNDTAEYKELAQQNDFDKF